MVPCQSTVGMMYSRSNVSVATETLVVPHVLFNAKTRYGWGGTCSVLIHHAILHSVLQPNNNYI